MKKAAEKGEPGSMRNLGLLYYGGHGVAPDYAKAREWYEKAAQEGDAVAMSNLGLLYTNGQGVAQDYVEARKWYEKAAEKGDAGAMTNLGALYAEGRGVAQDTAKAREWYAKAAEIGEVTAMSNLGVIYVNGQGAAQDYGKAREWFEKAAEKGDAKGMHNLGVLYENGYGVAQDYGKAREWFEKAADKGDAAAKAVLENVSILAAEEAGRYAEALKLVQARAAKEEVAETERDAKAGKQTARALNEVAWYALFAQEFTQALSAADRAHALLPGDLEIDINRAHALMFLGRGEESEALYLAHKGEPMSDEDRSLWESAIAKDFADLRKTGLPHPMMAEIEKKLGVSP